MYLHRNPCVLKPHTIALVAGIALTSIFTGLAIAKDWSVFSVASLGVGVTGLAFGVAKEIERRIDVRKIQEDCNSRWKMGLFAIASGMQKTYMHCFENEDIKACAVTLEHLTEIANVCADLCSWDQEKHDLESCTRNVSRYLIEIKYGKLDGRSDEAVRSLVAQLRTQSQRPKEN